MSKPVIVFDLDDTLFENRPWNRTITNAPELVDWMG